MITRALDADVPATWVAGGDVYGNATGLRQKQERRIGSVLAVACSHRVDTGAGPMRADQIAKSVPHRAWQLLSAGDGSKGRRWYQWALAGIADTEHGHRWLLIPT